MASIGERQGGRRVAGECCLNTVHALPTNRFDFRILACKQEHAIRRKWIQLIIFWRPRKERLLQVFVSSACDVLAQVLLVSFRFVSVEPPDRCNPILT